MWRWILLCVILLLALLCWTRVGVEAALSEGVLRLDVRFGLFHLRILPAKKGKKRKEKKPKPAKPPKEKAPKEKGKPSFTKEDILDALHTFPPVLVRTLRRTRRGVRIRPLRLRLTLSGREDPPTAALLYGRLQTAVWTGMPLAERLVDIREPSIHIGVDFDASRTGLEGEVGVTFRIGTLIVIGCGLAFPALRWFLRTQRRKKAVPKQADTTEEQASAL